RLYEASAQIAGLAATFRDRDGFTSDFGAHFVTNRLAVAIGVASSCRDVRHYGEAVFLGGKVFGYPFGILRNPRFASSGLAARLSRWQGRRQGNGAPRSAAEWFRAAYGNALADAVAIPLVEAWSGVSADALSPGVASEKLRHGVLHTLWLNLAGRITKRAVANGYSHEKPESPSVWHVYPEGGVSTLVQRLADELDPSSILLETPVEAIVVEDGQVVGVRANGREDEVSAVVSTAPAHVLARLVVGTDATKHLSKFRFRPMVFLNLRLRGRGLLPDTVLWVPEREFPFFRITETTISMPWLAPAGKCMLTVDFGCEKQDEIWSMAEDRLLELCLEYLTRIIPDVRQRLLGSHVLRTPIAYPVYLNEYEADRIRLRETTGVAGLYSVGRNGEFAHILMEDVYWRTLGRMRQMVATLGLPANS
ncbi:MAG: FAD-dependent oxidoreductase, partial [Gemmatimonadales bacterium]|nr:FAD-dependent oxidoreductase [Gemmatimonadales bacterium]